MSSRERALWQNSEFEEPLYFRERSSYVPSYLRRNCDSDGVDTRDLHYYTAREDIRKSYSIMKSLGGTYYYDNTFIHNYLSFLYNVCNCLNGNSISYTCPDPCRKPDVCMIEKHVIRGSCRKVKDKKRVSNLKDGDFKNIFGSIYLFKAVCTCKKGFIWNSKVGSCDIIRSGCDLKRVGDRVCQHGGKCLPVPSEDREYDFLILRCVCLPAWKGYLCTEPVNPCIYSRRLCGSFICRRDATSISKGYYCICSKGFRRFSPSEPRCVNIDECHDVPCQHGGKCLDLTPDPLNVESLLFNCSCIRGFTGQICEIPPKRPQWSTWSSWSSCSKSCGIGEITRQRVCTVSGRCSGLPVQSTACILLGLTCDFTDDLEQEDTLKLQGIGWSAEEERIIDDAFHWNEQLFSENPQDTLHYLKHLKLMISVITGVILIPLFMICLFNLIILRPYQWFMISLKSHIIRQGWIKGGKEGRERKKKAKQFKKMIKTAKKRIKHQRKAIKTRVMDVSEMSVDEDDEDSSSGGLIEDEDNQPQEITT